MTQWQEWSLTIKWEMFCEGESLREKVPRCQGLGWCSLRPLARAGAEVSSGRAAKYEEWRVCCLLCSAEQEIIWATLDSPH